MKNINRVLLKAFPSFYIRTLVIGGYLCLFIFITVIVLYFSYLLAFSYEYYNLISFIFVFFFSLLMNLYVFEKYKYSENKYIKVLEHFFLNFVFICIVVLIYIFLGYYFDIFQALDCSSFESNS